METRRDREAKRRDREERCLRCGGAMEWRHQTWQCARCGFKLGCCEGEPQSCTAPPPRR